MTSRKALALKPRRAVSCAAVVASSVLLACGPQDDGGAGGSLAASGSGGNGVSPTAGNSATGGSGGSLAGAAGSNATSGASSGGASAGTSSGGMAGGGASGSGGASADSGGTGGGAGSGGTGGGGGKVEADPSAGCGKASPQTGSSQSPLTVSGHQYYLKLPTNYDASKPYPVMIMFNPTNNPISWAEQSAGFEATGPKENWIRVYPHPANSSAGWNGSDVSFFQPLYDQITANLCIDKARIFTAGESSGGDFASILGCEFGDKVRATAPCATKPVNGYPLDVPTKRQCKGEAAVVVIHGKNDSVVTPANGPKTRDFYVALNHCTMTTMPVADYSDTLSNCVMYQGCDPGYPVYWCNHTDPNYGNTNHGWPAFAPKFLYSLFSSY